VRAKHFLISHDGTVKLSGLRTTISTIRNGIRCSAIHDHSSATVNNICWLAPEVLAQVTKYYKYYYYRSLRRMSMDIQKVQMCTA